MVKNVDMSSFPPVVIETALHLRSKSRHKVCPMKTMEIQTAVPNVTDIYCHFTEGLKWVHAIVGKRIDIYRAHTQLTKILRAKIKAIVDGTCNDPDVVEAEKKTHLTTP